MSVFLSTDAMYPLVQGTCGALVVAMALSSVVLGCTILQAYYYFDRFKSDGTYLKVFVVALVAFDMADTISAILIVWWYTVLHYGDFDSLARLPLVIGVEVGLASVVTLMAHSFFVVRVWYIGGRNFGVPGVIRP
ncbi:hypothetical protein CERSUDRAFT_127598 [Gelatoporia subvermispora B]|uniref:Uncharacterized protein n=1 Tax=Ceriporiopsis subvermispora (strain B) TaxID=914234 RepID=M2P724_CERS8|nr:hypothetical protein CERSUDRAFT_127598 [Gelatoporia subvermispora B]